MTVLKAIGIAAALACLLAACEMSVPTRSFPEIGFAHKPPYKLDVAQIEVETPVQPAPEKGTVLHELPVSLTGVAERWAKQRLEAVGQNGTAVVRIERARVVEERLEKTGGVRGAFTTDQTERYIGNLEISISIADNRGQAMARAAASRTRTVAEDATLADRERLWFEMVEQLARGVDAQMDQQIPAHLAAYLR